MILLMKVVFNVLFLLKFVYIFVLCCFKMFWIFWFSFVLYYVGLSLDWWREEEYWGENVCRYRVVGVF